MKFYLEAGVVASEFFSSAVPKSVYDDQVDYSQSPYSQKKIILLNFTIYLFQIPRNDISKPSFTLQTWDIRNVTQNSKSVYCR